MQNEDILAQRGFLEAKNITKHFAKTFYCASRLLPVEKRKAAYAIYAICRFSDESVDNTDPARDRSALQTIGQHIETAYGITTLHQPLLASFRKTINTFDIPKEYFDELLSGMEMDLVKTRYATFDELYDYCYKVAGVVGLIMLRVFGFRDQKARIYAIKLGVAMQLTNIIRDIAEDFARGRIYIPLDEMARFHVDEAAFEKKLLSPELRELCFFSATRAHRYYRQAETGIQLITNKRCRLTVAAMANLYEGILDDAARHGFNFFIRRAHVWLPGKITRITGILAQGVFS
ncbi:MAG TPA: phytoene/squalene synthase family protein [Candidatus Omnitrophota bacterium]|nr:phytoene/squalene synthase family protein [Candidatus Omnitrophota bacterium]HPT07894.1 phytoene/squalene synthase family protein [Candidatus Omnitrophota bacterium]